MAPLLGCWHYGDRNHSLCQLYHMRYRFGAGCILRQHSMQSKDVPCVKDCSTRILHGQCSKMQNSHV
jgi:hypothetical protein